MADIDVVPKRRTNVWMWIIAAIVLAVILIALMGAFSGDGANRVGELLNPLPTSPGVVAVITTT
jgi:uncharacterized protein YggT (Ycf19 family)